MGLNRLEKELKFTCVTVAGPLVGEANFKQCFDNLNVKLIRLVMPRDLIPKTPVVGFHPKSKKMLNYVHVGFEFKLQIAEDDAGLGTWMPRVFFGHFG